AARALQSDGPATTSLPYQHETAPPTPFITPLTTERRFAWQAHPFAEIRAIRSALGCTVNDLVLTILSGALGRYLRSHGHRTDGVELRAMCPGSMRRPDERGTLGNLGSV